MSNYRLVFRGVFSVAPATGDATAPRVIEARAYESPKAYAVGTIEIAGRGPIPYKRTGGRGRGTVSTRYVYVPFGADSTFFPITEGEASALVGGRGKIERVALPDSPAPTIEAPKAEAPKAEAPTIEPIEPIEPTGEAPTEPTIEGRKARRARLADEKAEA